MSISIGADPEFFVTDPKGNFVSSIGKIGGDKGRAVRISPDLASSYGWLEDNVAVEINLKKCDSGYDFASHISYMWPFIKQELGRKGLYPKVVPCAKFLKSELMHDKAHVFGCEPDFDAYEYKTVAGKPLPRPCPVPQDNMRYAGGHIHLGFDNKHDIPTHAVAMLLDMYIGLPSLRHDTQGLRRHVYGKAGLYRPKPYGLEYRTMSNWWLEPNNSSALTLMARELETLAAYLERCPDELASVFDKTPIQDVREVINTANAKEANVVWQEINSNTRRFRHELDGLGMSFKALQV